MALFGGSAPVALLAMRSRPSVKPGLLALVAAVVLFAAACSHSGAPEAFEEQPGPVGEDLAAALGIDAEDELPLVQRNFLEGCILGDAESDSALTPAQRAPICECSYDGIISFYLDTAEGETEELRRADAFASFEALNDELEDPAAIPPANIQTILDDCRS